jgi:hypothetical protein
MEEIINVYTNLWLVSLKGRENFEFIGVDWRIILKWILEK